jgi:hypothetical protein
MGPRPTHRKEVSGGGAAINTIAMASGLAFGLAMGHGGALFWMWMSQELFLPTIPTLIINWTVCSLLSLYFVVKYANIFYLSCKDLSDRIRKITLFLM